MHHGFSKKGFKVDRQKPIALIWNNIHLDLKFRSDLVVDGKVIS